MDKLKEKTSDLGLLQGQSTFIIRIISARSKICNVFNCAKNKINA
jgi:hypothetical protein